MSRTVSYKVVFSGELEIPQDIETLEEAQKYLDDWTSGDEVLSVGDCYVESDLEEVMEEEE